MKLLLSAAAWSLLISLPGAAQSFDAPACLNPAAMASLARQALASLKAAEGEKALDQTFRLRILSGDYPGALEAMAALRALRTGDGLVRTAATRQHELYARTRLREAAGKEVGAALTEAFAAMVKDLDDRGAYQFQVALRGRGEDTAAELQRTYEPLRNKRRLTMGEAMGLLTAYGMNLATARLGPAAAALMAEEEGRRYLIDEDVRIRTPEGATLCATVARPRRTAAKLPTAFQFTIYANASNRNEAIHSASEGFVGVVATSRGKGGSPDAVVPYEHDGVDAARVIDWIADQAWSDGQVGMYGGSYDGFTQWAAAKHHPRALRSLMPSVPVAPGIDTPMEGGVFRNLFYKWIPYVTRTRGLDEADYNDWGRWNGLDWSWFESGRPYRELPDLDGRPNPLWLRWLDHTLRGGPRPPRLQGRVNYEVMGANLWKAAPSLEGMANSSLRRYLSPTRSGDALQLTERPVKGAIFRQEVDFADHDQLQFGQPQLIQDKRLDTTHGFAFATEPLSAPLEVSGCFSGELRFTVNKKDLDLALGLYELTKEGDYLLLSTWLGRASWRKDSTTRRLIVPGRPTVLPFRSGRLTSRLLAKGSRLVFLLSVPRQPRMQMNLGSGKDVSDEVKVDGETPLRITWSGESFVQFPVWR